MAMEIDESEIGDTPLVRFDGVGEPDGARIYLKVEWFNLYSTPYGGGSVKSRPAKYMIDAGEESGELTSDKTVIEPTSGNTGSEVAKIARNRGYDVTIVLPDNAGQGKIDTIRDTGAEIEFTDALEGYDRVIERAHEIYDSDPESYYMPDQYGNPANPRSHEETTAREIWRQTDGEVDAFVAGVGTGGTITGCGRGLGGLSDGGVDVVAVEPDDALHAIDGLKYMEGEDHLVPDIYDQDVLDDKLYVSTDDSYDRAKQLRSRYADEHPYVVDPGQHSREVIEDVLRVDGEFLVGTSTGTNLEAAIRVAEESEEDEPVVVTMACDRGDKYENSLWRELLGE